MTQQPREITTSMILGRLRVLTVVGFIAFLIFMAGGAVTLVTFVHNADRSIAAFGYAPVPDALVRQPDSYVPGIALLSAGFVTFAATVMMTQLYALKFFGSRALLAEARRARSAQLAPPQPAPPAQSPPPQPLPLD